MASARKWRNSGKSMGEARAWGTSRGQGRIPKVGCLWRLVESANEWCGWGGTMVYQRTHATLRARSTALPSQLLERRRAGPVLLTLPIFLGMLEFVVFMQKFSIANVEIINLKHCKMFPGQSPKCSWIHFGLWNGFWLRVWKNFQVPLSPQKSFEFGIRKSLWEWKWEERQCARRCRAVYECAGIHSPRQEAQKKPPPRKLTKTTVACHWHQNYIKLSPHECLPLLLFVFQNVPMNSKRSTMFP